MQAYKKEFIEFMIECGVLTFGDFVTKRHLSLLTQETIRQEANLRDLVNIMQRL